MGDAVRALLDTNVIIASGSGPEELPDLDGFTDLFISSVSYSELTMGLHGTTDLAVYKARVARLDAAKEVFGAGLPYDDDCVQAYGKVVARVAERGGEVRAHRLDRMIAATALARGLVLVTRNVAHFRLVDDLIEVVRR